MNTHDIELPPLPSPFCIVDPMGSGEKIYTLKDMGDYARAYARSAIESDRKLRGEPDWDAIKGKRMCELSQSQINDAHELWLREQWRWFGEQEGSAGNHIKFLLDRLDEIRAPQPAEPCASSVSDKTACGSENGDCDSQPAEPVKVPSDADAKHIRDFIA